MDGISDSTLKEEISRALAISLLNAENVEFVRVRQDYDIETDKTKVRMEVTFEY